MDEMYDGISAGGAMLLLYTCVYVGVVWQAGKLVQARGRDLLGRRLRTISINSVMFSMLGGLGGGMVGMFLANFGEQSLNPITWLGCVCGWAYGVWTGWNDPMSG